MPSYEYKCEKCQAVFLNNETSADHEQHQPVECPKCGSTKVAPLISTPQVQNAKKS